MNFLFLDVEATGLDVEDRLLQVAYKYNSRIENALFKPPVPIKIAAMAIHHVTEKMVVDKPAFIESSEFTDLTNLSNQGIVLIAHNAPYDLAMLKKEGISFPLFIDTLKVAKFLDEGQFENHQMQYLRYYYGIELEATAHDALGDILVLEQVTAKLSADLAKKENLEGVDITNRMIEISLLPILIKVCNWKQHKGKTWEWVTQNDRGLVEWGLKKQMEKPEAERDHDLVYTFKHYLGV